MAIPIAASVSKTTMALTKMRVSTGAVFFGPGAAGVRGELVFGSVMCCGLQSSDWLVDGIPARRFHGHPWGCKNKTRRRGGAHTRINGGSVGLRSRAGLGIFSRDAGQHVGIGKTGGGPLFSWDQDLFRSFLLRRWTQKQPRFPSQRKKTDKQPHYRQHPRARESVEIMGKAAAQRIESGAF